VDPRVQHIAKVGVAWLDFRWGGIRSGGRKTYDQRRIPGPFLLTKHAQSRSPEKDSPNASTGKSWAGQVPVFEARGTIPGLRENLSAPGQVQALVGGIGTSSFDYDTNGRGAQLPLPHVGLTAKEPAIEKMLPVWARTSFVERRIVTEAGRDSGKNIRFHCPTSSELTNRDGQARSGCLANSLPPYMLGL